MTFVIFIRLRAAGNGTPRGDSVPPASHRLNSESPLIGRSPLQIGPGSKQMKSCSVDQVLKTKIPNLEMERRVSVNVVLVH